MGGDKSANEIEQARKRRRTMITDKVKTGPLKRGDVNREKGEIGEEGGEVVWEGKRATVRPVEIMPVA